MINSLQFTESSYFSSPQDESLPLRQSDNGISIEINDVSTLNNKGSELFALGRYEQAIE
jgi:hypothetical protein